MNHCDVVT